MNSSKYLRIIVPLVYMLLIFIGSSFPGNNLVMKGIFHYDKLLHLLEYSVFGVIISWAVIRNDHVNGIYRKIGLVLLIGWGYGILDEIHQSFVPARSMDIHDFAADAIGVILGFGIYILLMNKLYPKAHDAS